MKTKTRCLTKIATFLIMLILTVPAFLPWTGRFYSAAADNITEETSEMFYFYPGASSSANKLHYISFRLCLSEGPEFYNSFYMFNGLTVHLNVEETEYEYIETSKELTLEDFVQHSSGFYYTDIVVKADYETKLEMTAEITLTRKGVMHKFVAKSVERSIIEVFATAVANNSPQVAASENYETILDLVERHNNGENVNEFVSPDIPDDSDEPENPDNPSGTEDLETPAGNNDPETSDNTPETDNTSDSEENKQKDVSENEDEKNNDSTYKSMYTILIVVGFIVMLIIAVSMFLPKRRS